MATEILQETGFVICEFPPELGYPGLQLYYRKTDYWSHDGEYWCLTCIKKEHEANEHFERRYTMGDLLDAELIKGVLVIFLIGFVVGAGLVGAIWSFYG